MLVTRPAAPGTVAGTVSMVAQWLLAPTLAVGLWLAVPAPRPRVARWALAALAGCFLGDLLPSLVPREVGFLAMVGPFLLAQLAWIGAFLPWRRHALAGWRRWVATAYLIVAVALLAICLPAAGGLAGPVVGYAAALTTMAVLALGPNRLTGWGGGLFLLSDALIAIDHFAPQLAPPAVSVAIMATYAAALGALTTGVRSGAGDDAQ